MQHNLHIVPARPDQIETVRGVPDQALNGLRITPRCVAFTIKPPADRGERLINGWRCRLFEKRVAEEAL